MKFAIVAAFVLVSVSQVLAMPTNATLSARDNLTCGTTSNAVASDCDSLLDSNFSVNYGKGHTCSYFEGMVWGRVRAYNPVCSPGNCCIYTTDNQLSADEVRGYAKELMKCRSVAKNRINGRIPTRTGFLCISDGKGCGDCFDD